jgi:hypothetical protein
MHLYWFLSYLSFFNCAPSSLCLVTSYLKPYLYWWQWVGITTSSPGTDSLPKGFLGALIFGIVSLITLIASTTTASVALTQQIQTAHYVNTLSKNVSNILHSQNDLNRDLQQGILKLQKNWTLWKKPSLEQSNTYSSLVIPGIITSALSLLNGTAFTTIELLIQHYIQGACTQNLTIHIQRLTCKLPISLLSPCTLYRVG